METGAMIARKAEAGKRPQWRDIAGAGAGIAPQPVGTNIATVQMQPPKPMPSTLDMAGDVVSKAGRLLEAAALAVDQHDSIEAVQEATEYRKRMGAVLEGENGILYRKGEQAFEAVQETEQAQKQIREELLKNRSDSVRRHFESQVAEFDAGCLARTGKHAGQERRAWEMQTWASAADEAAETASVSDDPQVLADAVVRLEENTAKFLTAKGYGGEALRRGVQKASSSALTAAVAFACEQEDTARAKALLRTAGEKLTEPDRRKTELLIRRTETQIRDRAEREAEKLRRTQAAEAEKERAEVMFQAFQSALAETGDADAASAMVMSRILEASGGKMPERFQETARLLDFHARAEKQRQRGETAQVLAQVRRIMGADAPLYERKEALERLDMRPDLRATVRKELITPEEAGQTAEIILNQLEDAAQKRALQGLPAWTIEDEEAAAAVLLRDGEPDPDVQTAAAALISTELKRKFAMQAAEARTQAAQLTDSALLAQAQGGGRISQGDRILAQGSGAVRGQALERFELLTIGGNTRRKKKQDLITGARLASDPRFMLLPEEEQIQLMRDAGISLANLDDVMKRSPILARFPDETLLNWVKTVDGGKKYLRSMNRAEKEAFCDMVRQDPRLLQMETPTPQKMREVLKDAVSTNVRPAVPLNRMEKDKTALAGIERALRDLYGEAYTKELTPQIRTLLTSWLYARRMGTAVLVTPEERDAIARAQGMLWASRRKQGAQGAEGGRP